MKTIEISKGGTTAVKIELHDPELSVVVHDAVAEDVKQLPDRMLYKGQRVRNLQESHYVKKGATGTVDQDNDVPWVIWDSPEMLTDLGRCEDTRWVQVSRFLEVIEEVKEEVKEFPVRMLYKGQRVRNLRDTASVKKGANGTVDEDSVLPWVIWDSPEMLTDAGRRRENRRWVQDSCFLEVKEEVKELPVRMLYKGQRVRNLREIHHVKKGATGTVDDDHDLPYVIWDSPEMLTDAGRRRENRRWVQDSCFLEVIEDVKEVPYLSNPRDTNPDEPREVKALFDASRIAEAVRIETRDGREVKCVVVNDVEAEYPVTGYVNGGMLTWTYDGRFSIVGLQRPLDLFMVVKEVRND